MVDAAPFRELRHVDIGVLVDRDRVEPPALRRDELERAGLDAGERLLGVVGRDPESVGLDPDLEEVDGLRRRGVVLAVADAAPALIR